MKHSNNAKNLIIKSRPLYKEKIKLWNNHYYIGYSHMIRVSESLTNINNINKKDSLILLEKDLNRISSQLNKHLEVIINQNQFDALVSLIYDIGIKSFISDEIFSLINKNNLTEASSKFRKFNRYMKKPVYQLIKTRKLEMELFNSPINTGTQL